MPGWSSFLQFATKAVKNPAVRAAGTALMQRVGSRGAGRALRVVGGAAAGTALYAGARHAAGEYFGEPDNGYAPRRRRINPMNSRAAMRAIRRITQVRKILRRIEGKMPKARCRKCSGGGWRRGRK